MNIKKPLVLLMALISATTALHAEADPHQLEAPMPVSKTPAQLAKWRADVAAQTVAAEAAQAKVADSTPQGFYTGKPYMAESGSYSFKYREYNPEMARWTTVDPSGFPDGANATTYCKNMPVNGFDWLGAQTVLYTDTWNQTFVDTFNLTQAGASVIAGLGIAASGAANPISDLAGLAAGGLGLITSTTGFNQTASSTTLAFADFPGSGWKLIGTNTVTTSTFDFSPPSANAYGVVTATITQNWQAVTSYSYE